MEHTLKPFRIENSSDSEGFNNLSTFEMSENGFISFSKDNGNRDKNNSRMYLLLNTSVNYNYFTRVYRLTRTYSLVRVQILVYISRKRDRTKYQQQSVLKLPRTEYCTKK